MSASMLWIVTVQADGRIWTTGHTHVGGAAHWPAPEGGEVLAFLEDPHVSSQTHRFDFATRAFAPLG